MCLVMKVLQKPHYPAVTSAVITKLLPQTTPRSCFVSISTPWTLAAPGTRPALPTMKYCNTLFRYQAFVIFRSDSKIRVHFNGWSSNVRQHLSPCIHLFLLIPFPDQPQYDEDILSDSIAVRTRPRNADTPTGSSGNESDDAVRAAVASSLLKYNMRELSSDARCLHPYVFSMCCVFDAAS